MKEYTSPAIEVTVFSTEAHTMLTVSNEMSSQPQLSGQRDADSNCDWGADE